MHRNKLAIHYHSFLDKITELHSSVWGNQDLVSWCNDKAKHTSRHHAGFWRLVHQHVQTYLFTALPYEQFVVLEGHRYF